MKYHELSTSAKKTARRVGRGIAAGQGKTAGRGTKGQGSRSGYSKKPGFEGGQNPLMQRMPKLRGFKSKAERSINIYTEQLNDFSGKVDNFALVEKGIMESPFVKVKLLARGEVTKAVKVELQAASLNAIELVQKAGGSFTVMAKPARVAKKKDN